MATRTWKTIAVAALAALVLAACGDDDGAGDDAPTTTTAAATTTTAAGDTTTAAPTTTADDGAADEPTVAGEGATVTVAGEEFVLDSAISCVTMGGAFGGVFGSADGSLSFHVDLPPTGGDTSEWPPPSVRLDIEGDEERSWRAGGEVVASMEGVPTTVSVLGYAVEGSTATGSALVVDLDTVMAGEPQTAEMDFAVSCG
ncbi:MAG: hypothetical protein R3290_00125 [Acidimicrobiia bacterium]|nr:hypothetical protein [Acidimicrobiia bacterium]